MKCHDLGYAIVSSGRSGCERHKAAAFDASGFRHFGAFGGVHQSTVGSGPMFHASDTEYPGTCLFTAEL
jgi:hypothetical protein